MEEQREIKSLVELMRWMDELGIPPEDARRARAYSQFMDNKARNVGTPLTGIFELTPLCNFDCKMCYVHLAPQQLGERRILRKEAWLSLVDEAISMGMLNAQLTGGEAMLHPDFDEIYLYLFEHGVRIVVMTNGVLLDEERIDFFKKYTPASIQITMYGGDEDSYERVTGRRDYELVLEHIKKAKELDCRLVLTATPSRYFGKKELASVIAFAKEHELTIRVNNDLNVPREETGRRLSDFDLTEEEIFELKAFMAGKEISELKEEKTNLPPAGNHKEPVCGIRCGAGRDVFCINWEGHMKACLDLEEYEEPLQIGFSEAWARINAFAKAYEVPRECVDCPYISVCNPCPVIHAIGAPKGHVDRRICARTRRLVATGCLNLPESE